MAVVVKAVHSHLVEPQFCSGVGKHFIGPVGPVDRQGPSQPVFKKIARLLGWLGSGPCLMGWLGSGPRLVDRIGSGSRLVADRAHGADVVFTYTRSVPLSPVVKVSRH